MGGQSAPSGYQPTWQAGADNNFQTSQAQLSQTGQQLGQFAPSAYSSIYQNMLNNPYAATAQSGANAASNIGMNQVAPAQLSAAQTAATQAGNSLTNAQAAWDTGVGTYDNTVGMMPGVMSQAGTYADLVPRAQQDASTLYNAIPQATAGYGAADQTYGLSLSGLSMIPGMENAAQQVLNTSMDPQNALYDKNYQTAMQQSAAQSALNGVSGSPFAAGVASDASSNFNIDWNAQQLQNQIAGLNAYTNTMGTAGNLAQGFINGAATDFNNLTNGATSNLNTLVGSADTMLQNAKQTQYQDRLTSMQDAVNNYSTLGTLANSQLGQATNTWDTLTNDALNGYSTASDLGAAGLNTMTTSAMYPNQVYANNQSQIMQALNALVSGTNSSQTLNQDAIQNDLNYLKTGQSATQLSQNAAQINNEQLDSMLSGLGGIAGMSMAPFTGGMSLFGDGGLLGSAGGLSSLLNGSVGIGNTATATNPLAGMVSATVV